ncbi:MAG: hypothetical protein AAF288_01650 [Planctomycetota bacterium]
MTRCTPRTPSPCRLFRRTTAALVAALALGAVTTPAFGNLTMRKVSERTGNRVIVEVFEETDFVLDDADAVEAGEAVGDAAAEVQDTPDAGQAVPPAVATGSTADPSAVRVETTAQPDGTITRRESRTIFDRIFYTSDSAPGTQPGTAVDPAEAVVPTDPTVIATVEPIEEVEVFEVLAEDDLRAADDAAERAMRDAEAQLRAVAEQDTTETDPFDERPPTLESWSDDVDDASSTDAPNAPYAPTQPGPTQNINNNTITIVVPPPVAPPAPVVEEVKAEEPVPVVEPIVVEPIAPIDLGPPPDPNHPALADAKLFREAGQAMIERLGALAASSPEAALAEELGEIDAVAAKLTAALDRAKADARNDGEGNINLELRKLARERAEILENAIAELEARRGAPVAALEGAFGALGQAVDASVAARVDLDTATGRIESIMTTPVRDRPDAWASLVESEAARSSSILTERLLPPLAVFHEAVSGARETADALAELGRDALDDAQDKQDEARAYLDARVRELNEYDRRLRDRIAQARRAAGPERPHDQAWLEARYPEEVREMIRRRADFTTPLEQAGVDTPPAPRP